MYIIRIISVLSVILGNYLITRNQKWSLVSYMIASLSYMILIPTIEQRLLGTFLIIQSIISLCKTRQ